MQQQPIPYGHCHCGCGAKTRLAARTYTGLGIKKGEPLKWIKGHQNRKASREYVEEDRGYRTPCWIWQLAGFTQSGYGYARWEGKAVTAHRMMWSRMRGQIPEKHDLDHLCRVRLCVNPDHLEPVTRSENMRRGKNAKLTADKVRAIRASSDSFSSLARQFGVSRTCIEHIRHRVTWKDLD